jgi:multicomponent Na+:H+ antiporter subunit A
VNRSLILDGLVEIVIRTALVFALFLLFSGHNAPGGGFVAGLVAGSALILWFVAGGRAEVDRVVLVSPQIVMGTGLALAVGTGALGWMWGDGFLESVKIEFVVPVLGTVKATSALPFDIGVFLIVIGLTAALVLTLGDTDGEQE